MLATIAEINKFHEDAGITEVSLMRRQSCLMLFTPRLLQPSLMNFCITDGESVVVTRYISSRKDAAASLVRSMTVVIPDFY